MDQLTQSHYRELIELSYEQSEIIASLKQEVGKLASASYERGRDLEDINALLEEEIQYTRELEEDLDLENEAWYRVFEENRELMQEVIALRLERDAWMNRCVGMSAVLGAPVYWGKHYDW